MGSAALSLLPMSDSPIAGLDRTQLLVLYHSLVVTRAAEERLEMLHKQGHVTGEVYSSLGQEAGAVGAAFALDRRTDGTGDFLAPTVRAAGALFLFGGELVDFFRQYMARATGPTGGKEASVHWVDFQKGIVGPVSPLGTMLEVMAGITLSFKVRGEPRVGIVFYGDAASSTGAWHEGLNFSAVQRCPLILMVEANQWMFSTATTMNTRVQSFTDKAAGYGIGSESVDGTDIVAVYEAVSRAAKRARAGEGTQMVELSYYRRLDYVQHDPQESVDPDELAMWEGRDPITLFERRVLEEGWAEEPELEEIRGRAEEDCRLAAEQAVSEPVPYGPEAVEGIYTDTVTPHPWTRTDEPDKRATSELKT